MLKVEAIIEEVMNGEVTQLRIGDDVFAIKFIGCYKDIAEAVVPEEKESIKKETPKENEPLDKGKILDYIGKSPIYTNIFNEIVETTGTNYNKNIYRKIIKKYYPKNPITTIRSYISTYKRSIEREFNIEPKAKHIKYRRYRRRKPTDAVGYDKAYHRWIKQDEYNKVKTATFTYGVVPTMEFLSKASGLSLTATRAVIHYMKDENKINVSSNSDGVLRYNYIG